MATKAKPEPEFTEETESCPMGLMTLPLLLHIRGRKDLNAGEKVVAYTLALHRNPVTLACFPSIATTAKGAGLRVRATVNYIKGLEKKRVIAVRRDTKGPRGRAANRYVFLFDVREALSEELEHTGVDAGTHELLMAIEKRFKV